MTVVPLSVFSTVTLECSATVEGERIVVRMAIDGVAYDCSEELRESAHRSIRMELMHRILEKWSPVVKVLR